MSPLGSLSSSDANARYVRLFEETARFVSNFNYVLDPAKILFRYDLRGEYYQTGVRSDSHVLVYRMVFVVKTESARICFVRVDPLGPPFFTLLMVYQKTQSARICFVRVDSLGPPFSHK